MIVILGQRFPLVGFPDLSIVVRTSGTIAVWKSFEIAEMDLSELFKADVLGAPALVAVQQVEEKSATVLDSKLVAAGFTFGLKLGAHFSSLSQAT